MARHAKTAVLDDPARLMVAHGKARLLEDGKCADIHNVRYSNFCDISLHHDKRANKLVACAAIDNMVKGAAGQAIQNMNLLFGFDETAGLDMIPIAF